MRLQRVQPGVNYVIKKVKLILEVKVKHQVESQKFYPKKAPNRNNPYLFNPLKYGIHFIWPLVPWSHVFISGGGNHIFIDTNNT